MKLLQLFFLGILLIPHAIFAGGNEGGDFGGNGGDIVECNGKEPVVLDYYQATLKRMDGKNSALLSINGMQSEDVVNLVLDRLMYNFPIFRSQVFQRLEIIGAIDNWIVAPVKVKEIDDAAEVYNLPNGCKMLQVAVRQGDVVYVNDKLLNKLSPAQQGVLMLHEALYFLAVDFGATNSAAIRQLLVLLLQNELDENAVHKQLQKINIPTQFLSDSCFASEDLLAAIKDNDIEQVEHFVITKKQCVPKDILGYALQNGANNILESIIKWDRRFGSSEQIINAAYSNDVETIKKLENLGFTFNAEEMMKRSAKSPNVVKYFINEISSNEKINILLTWFQETFKEKDSWDVEYPSSIPQESVNTLIEAGIKFHTLSLEIKNKLMAIAVIQANEKLINQIHNAKVSFTDQYLFELVNRRLLIDLSINNLHILKTSYLTQLLRPMSSKELTQALNKPGNAMKGYFYDIVKVLNGHNYLTVAVMVSLKMSTLSAGEWNYLIDNKIINLRKNNLDQYILALLIENGRFCNRIPQIEVLLNSGVDINRQSPVSLSGEKLTPLQISAPFWNSGRNEIINDFKKYPDAKKTFEYLLSRGAIDKWNIKKEIMF